MIAQIFAAEHGLDDQMRENLQNQLSDNVDRYYAVRGVARPQPIYQSAVKTPVKMRKNSKQQSARRKSNSKSPLRDSYNNLMPVRQEQKETARNSQSRGREKAPRENHPDSRQAVRQLQGGMSDDLLSDNVSPEPPTERGVTMNQPSMKPQQVQP